MLVPCYPSGVIYDLLECLYQYIDSAGLSNIPFYFISPVANSSLEFSQIFAEWYVCVLLHDSVHSSNKIENVKKKILTEKRTEIGFYSHIIVRLSFYCLSVSVM